MHPSGGGLGIIFPVYFPSFMTGRFLEYPLIINFITNTSNQSLRHRGAYGVANHSPAAFLCFGRFHREVGREALKHKRLGESQGSHLLGLVRVVVEYPRPDLVPRPAYGLRRVSQRGVSRPLGVGAQRLKPERRPVVVNRLARLIDIGIHRSSRVRGGLPAPRVLIMALMTLGDDICV